MKSLDAKAQQVFDMLVEGLKRLGDHRKIDNAPGAFMPVHVELIDRALSHPVISIAHYYEQNSDLVCDPDVVFWSKGSKSYPLTFEQGGIAYQVAARVEDGSWHLNEKLQAQVTGFANTWMKNIAEQQGLPD